MSKLDYVKLIEETAQQIRDQAKEFLGEIDRVAEMTISIHITPNSIPTIEVNRTYYPKNLADLMHDAYIEEDTDADQG